MPRLRIAATGDSIVTRRLSGLRHDGFADLVDLVRSADVAYTNVEFVFPGRGRHPSTTFHGTHLGVSPDLLNEFQWLGFDVFGMANNHATDYGTDGLLSSMEELERRQMPYAGVGRTLREARLPVYVETAQGRVALISAGSSNARLSVAADPGINDAGRPGMAPVRVRKTHYVAEEKFDDFRSTLSESGVNVAAAGTTAPGIFFPYPDMNVYDGPPPGGFAVEGVFFAPSDRPRVETTALERDVEALAAVVREARTQADVVLVALHCHEGIQGRWNNEIPAEFLQPLAHTLIEAGADAILGTGPHMLRGIEIHKGRPILYSLGNFIFSLETIDSFPVEVYEQQSMDLSSTSADLYDKVTGYKDEPRFWETVLAQLVFEDGECTEVELVPVVLGRELPRSRRGDPALADAEHGRRILERLQGLSDPFETKLQIEERDGRVVGRITTS
ncbi:CapA family protein [Nocardioides astragali]|uniref:CapA family protein n=1 Tax=Nocardioides astragali TaxID=1776736 RepID=A0ABW2N954_9ACTN|nr:CapA family protein [Nocardioides astragali]